MTIESTWRGPWTDHYDPDEPCLHLNEETEIIYDRGTGLQLGSERVQYIMVIRGDGPAMHRVVLGRADVWGGMEYPAIFLNGLYINGTHAVCVGYLQQCADELRSLGLSSLEESSVAEEYTALTQQNIDREVGHFRQLTGGNPYDDGAVLSGDDLRSFGV